MKIHSIIHADFELPGYFLTWAKHHGFEFNETHIYNGEPLPTLSDYDVLLSPAIGTMTCRVFRNTRLF